MPKAADLVRVAPGYMGTPYKEMDCQAFVEKCLSDIGILENLPGSNAWYRHMTWVGTPEECKASFGSIPPGAFLFILEQDGGEPEKYKQDGIGNASHIGIYTGMTAAEMARLSDGVPNVIKFCFGDGAIHSSASRGFVCTSKFAGRSIDGGWNRVGIWDHLDYGFGIDKGGEIVENNCPYQARVIGGALNLRKDKKQNASRVCQIPNGSTVEVLENYADGWSFIKYQDEYGYAVSAYLQAISDGDMASIPRSEIEEMYAMSGKIHDMTGKWLGR